jgi:predicted RNA methylase
MTAQNQTVSHRLRNKQAVDDHEFDLVYPPEIRRVSATFWTPAEVALTGAEWLEGAGCRALLDVGAGAGKFCVVASLALGQRVTGIEQRAHLTEIGIAAAAHYGAQVEYVHGTIETIDVSPFDSLYLFNPFGENFYAPDEQLDAEVELSALRRMHDVTIVEHWLDSAPAQMRLLTYHGFGGRIPSNYALLHEELKGEGYLRLWQKTRPGRAADSAPEPDPRRRSSLRNSVKNS